MKAKRKVDEKIPPAAAKAAGTDISGPLSHELYLEIGQRYRKRFGYALIYADAQGNLLYGLPECREFPCREICRECRRICLEHSVQSGHPEVVLCRDEYALWSVPIMNNQKIHGSLIVVGIPAHPDNKPPAPIKEACEGLLELAVEYNLTNREFLKGRELRAVHRDEESKKAPGRRLNPILDLDERKPRLQELESALSQAVLTGESAAARRCLEAIFELWLGAGEESHPALLGSALQVLAAIFTAAGQISNHYSGHLEQHSSSAARLTRAESLEDITAELKSTLDAALEVAERHKTDQHSSQLGKALSYMEKNFHRHLTRKSVARACGMSESHLSHLLSAQTGRTFSDLLNQYRIDRAAQLMLRTDKSLLSISLETGFSDQSYFGRVFRRYRGMSPDQFRHRSD